MIITNIVGGLGNQMFQFANGLATAINANTSLKLDISEFENYKLHNGFELNKIFSGSFDIAMPDEISNTLGVKRLPIIRKILRKTKKGNVKSNYVVEPHFNYWAGITSVTDNTYIEGYWQSEKYFKSISEIIRREFRFKEPLLGINLELSEEIHLKNSVSLHIRRGDYISNKKNSQIYNACNTDYYNAAIEYIIQNIPNPMFCVFSDDINWAKNNLPNHTYKFVDNNQSSDSYIDMQLMSLCKHNIIANSTFSWWGAWLNSNEEKIVIAPNEWFNNDTSTEDLIPKSWVTL